MNTEIKMIKAFAELEGVEFHDSINKRHVMVKSKTRYLASFEYNPITDLALNCAARDKYQVEVCYRYNKCMVWVESTWVEVSFKDQSIEKSVIECILKSQGIWID